MATKIKVAHLKSVVTKSVAAKPLPARQAGVARKLKSSTNSSPKKSVLKKTAKLKPEVILVNDVIATPGMPLNLPAPVSKEYVVVHRCDNCGHLPMSVEKMITLFSVLIALLTVSVLIQIGQLDLNRFLAFVSPSAQASTHFISR